MTINTVGDLKRAIANLSDETGVQVLLNRNTKPFELFILESVEVHRGTPTRDDDGKPAFKFDGTGPATWAFLQIAREDGD